MQFFRGKKVRCDCHPWCKQSSFCVWVVWQSQSIKQLVQTKKN